MCINNDFCKTTVRFSTTTKSFKGVENINNYYLGTVILSPANYLLYYKTLISHQFNYETNVSLSLFKKEKNFFHNDCKINIVQLNE